MNGKKIEWKKVIPYNLQLNTMRKVLPTKGNLVYEYNPFRNYRLTEDKFWYKDNYYTQTELKEIFKLVPEETEQQGDKKTVIRYWKLNGVKLDNSDEWPELYEAGQLVDFITDELSFKLTNPVQIIPQYSYDGSVNLIINDGINSPKLINSRFSATGRNTYEIIDRKGNNDTNIYDSGEQFKLDTSLYKIVSKIPKLEFLGTRVGGNMPIGNYHFYFKLADADGNESNFVAESGLVSVFIGDYSYHSVHTGVKNQNSTKQVEFRLSNIDSAYDYINVYYSRYTAEGNENFVTEYKKILKKFSRNDSKLIITGFEDTQDVTASDINLLYNIVDSAKTSATCQNMLFLGNVKKPDIQYKELADLSLRIIPKVNIEDYNPGLTHSYSVDYPEKSYIDSKFIYNKTGYWPNELYRFGIVYILPNGELTPVFDVRGGINIKTDSGFTDISVYGDDDNRKYVSYNENTFLLTEPSTENKVNFENVKGVCSFMEVQEGQFQKIYSINFELNDTAEKELKKYVKGYFFVRQTRMPLVLAQGITIGIDNESRTPTIPTMGGLLSSLQNTLDRTHVKTEDINDVNYISEGFLKRYSFSIKAKSSSLWKKIGKIAGIAVAIVGAAALTVTTFGGGIAALLPVAQALTLVTSGATMTALAAVGTVALSAGIAAAGAAVLTTTIAASQELGQAIKRIGQKKSYNGKATKAPSGYKLVETDESRTLVESFQDRIIIKDPSENKVQGIICPDYTINQPYFNQIFIGNKHLIKTAYRQSSYVSPTGLTFFDNSYRHFYIGNYATTNLQETSNCEIIAVPDNVKCVGIKDELFRSRAGEAEEAWRYEQVAEKIPYTDLDDIKINSDIIRGSFGPYLAFINGSIGPAQIVNIYIPGYNESNMMEYIDVRMRDNSPFFAISDRFGFKDYQGTLEQSKTINHSVYRGDCYLCQFTQRINRNFNDPTAPYNDVIVDPETWKNKYDPNNAEKYAEINLGDVNAVPMGMWVTFQLRSSNNLNIRTLDGSSVAECAMQGHDKGYFPYYPMSVEGTFKHDESQIYNKGFTKSVGERWNAQEPDVPHIKNWFGTRIMYSDIHINDAFNNGYRTFRGTNYRDYTREYGEIVKLITLQSNLLCVFEHGVALIPVNERAVAAQGSGGLAYINTSNVLPENPKILSDMYGSQWADSIVKVPGITKDSNYQYVYGVDTVAKKIWRTNGVSFQCISDFKVQEFLNNNITLGERETTPILGIRNVKTHYNAYKRDVMFTFYDNTYGFEEKVWNLCWNELLQEFITFYSWVPSYMENINNTPFSFDRNTSKWIAKLGTSHTNNSFADGITLSNNIIEPPTNKLQQEILVGKLTLSNRVLPVSQNKISITYSLEEDMYNNKKDFEIRNNDELYFIGNIYDLYSELYYRNSAGNVYADDENHKVISTEQIGDTYVLKVDKKNPENSIFNKPIFKNKAGKRLTLPREKMVNPDKIVRLLNIKATIKIGSNLETPEDYYYNSLYTEDSNMINAGYYQSTIAVIPKHNMQFLSTDFWKHGQASIIDITDSIYPTYWYGKQHPFEFEFIVVNDPSVHKIFTNLEIVANKAKPESFHYEIVGECYDFAKDKPNMYIRQEALKALWQYNGGDLCYNKNFMKVQSKQQPKSADLIRKYLFRQDTINEIEDYYLKLSNTDVYDYKHLSGGEISYYPNRQEFRIWNHVQAVDINDLNQNDARSLISANCQYLEDKWRVQINPILICYKNEEAWDNPPLPIYNSQIPDLVIKTYKENEKLTKPEILGDFVIDKQSWLGKQDQNRKEIDVKDKFIKVRIRYSGEELAIINYINTIYRVSYS